jgi:hypothetical protein
MGFWYRAVVHLLCAVGAPALALAASSAATKAMQVQLVDAGALAAPVAALVAPPPPVTNGTADLIPAPLPNPDVQPPNLEGKPSPSLNPALLSRKLEFQGNGFANFSNLDYALDDKDKPAAGVNLSVPVK